MNILNNGFGMRRKTGMIFCCHERNAMNSVTTVLSTLHIM
jgi:hypothetical protein